jgi:hypothetical protein
MVNEETAGRGAVFEWASSGSTVGPVFLDGGGREVEPITPDNVTKLFESLEGVRGVGKRGIGAKNEHEVSLSGSCFGRIGAELIDLDELGGEGRRGTVRGMVCNRLS